MNDIQGITGVSAERLAKTFKAMNDAFPTAAQAMKNFARVARLMKGQASQGNTRKSYDHGKYSKRKRLN